MVKEQDDTNEDDNGTMDRREEDEVLNGNDLPAVTHTDIANDHEVQDFITADQGAEKDTISPADQGVENGTLFPEALGEVGAEVEVAKGQFDSGFNMTYHEFQDLRCTKY